MTQRNACPICNSVSLEKFLERKQIPVHQNLVMKEKDLAIQIARGDLDMLVCKNCGFVFNQSFDFSKLAYGEQYDNTQSYSQYFINYLDEIADYLINQQKICNSRIVEVGCGKGYFLKLLVSNKEANNIGYGFDPAYVGPSSELNGRLQFQQRYYGPDCADIRADVVICRHVIEHVPLPVELLKAIRSALESSPNARVFFETPCVEWILRNQVFWDFFYEHCSLFSRNSLATAFEIAGFQVDCVRSIFNNQYLWLEARLPTSQPSQDSAAIGNGAEIHDLVKQYVLSEKESTIVWKETIQSLSAKGKVAVWGAGAKGITFVNLMDPVGEFLDCIVDINPNKQGGYAAGTGHPIVSYQELEARGVTHAILMNPNYRDENIALLREAKIDLELVE